MEWITNSAEETRQLGRKLGACFQAGDRILLMGDLGAGKTTLTQGLAAGLGLGEKEYVRSPTFTLVNQYEGRLPIYHVDLYRLGDHADLESLGLEELMDQPGVVIVEWAEKLFFSDGAGKPHLFLKLPTYIKITLQILNDTQRKLAVESVGYPTDSQPVFSLQ